MEIKNAPANVRSIHQGNIPDDQTQYTIRMLPCQAQATPQDDAAYWRRKYYVLLNDVMKLAQAKSLDANTARVAIGLTALRETNPQADNYNRFDDMTDIAIAKTFAMSPGTASKCVQKLKSTGIVSRETDTHFHVNPKTQHPYPVSTSTMYIHDLPDEIPFTAPPQAVLTRREYETNKRARLACRACGSVGHWHRVSAWQCSECGALEKDNSPTTQTLRDGEMIESESQPGYDVAQVDDSITQILHSNIPTTQTLRDGEIGEPTEKKEQPPPTVGPALGAYQWEPVPNELAAYRHWVAWRRERDAITGRIAKIPVNPATGENAKQNDPTTWGSLQMAMDAVTTYGLNGIGFQLGASGCPTRYTVIDIDGCRDPQTGILSSVGSFLLKRFQSFAAVSPSGKGLHIWVRGKLPRNVGPRPYLDGKLEVYTTNHFMTWTGSHLVASPLSINDCQNELDALYAELQARKPNRGPVAREQPRIALNRSDAQVWERLRTNSLFNRLDAKDNAGYASVSNADMAFVNIVAAHANGDEHQIDRVFRQSGRMRDKWDRASTSDGMTYGALTISKAVNGLRLASTA